MKKFTFSFLMAGFMTLSALAQTNPTPYNLATSGNYSMTSWPAASGAGTYPTAMVFHRLSQANPNLTSTEVANITGAYNLATKTRMNGLDANGFSFTNSNTTPDNAGYQTNRGGHAILAINTTDRTDITISWTAGCTNLQTRKYAIRAQYRVGNSGAWTDVISGGGEYNSATSGVGSTNFGPVVLPGSCDNQSVVQIRWVYYFKSGASTNASTLFVDDISVTSIPLVTFSPLASVCTSTAPFVLSDGQPLGGTYSGPGVTGNIFDPAAAGVGTHTLTYTYTDGNGISNFATSNITVSSSSCVASTALTTSSCGATNLLMSDYIYCDPVYQAQDYEFEFVNTGLGYTQTRVRGQAITNIGLSAVQGLQYGQTYDVRVRAKVGGVWGDFSGVCQITLQALPTTQLVVSQCGASGIATNGTLSCNSVAGADDYEFTLSNAGLPYSQSKARGQGIASISLNNFTGLISGTTYDVTVKVKVGGIWSAAGATCQVTLNGGIGTTTLDGASCGATGLSRSTGVITCTSVPSAVSYQWRFYNGTTLVTSNTTNGTSITLGNVQGLVAGNSYNVDVRAKVGTTWGSYSTRCAITLSTPAMAEVIEVQRSMDVEEGTTAENFNLFPNPVEAGQQIHIAYDLPADLDGAEMQVEVFDLSGRVVYTARTTGAAGSNMVTIPVAADMQAGIYFAKTIVNGQETVIRFVVK
jgi:hypothetical protein